jgi:anti-sigma regulatory factor (Ser/Thr protein kinase)
MTRQAVIAVTDDSQIGAARRVVAKLAEAAALDETRRGQIAIVATELATNLARYGKNGKLLVQAIATAAGKSIEMLAIDSGPGISDVQRSLQDGFSTGGTPGNGLGAIRRLSNEFDLFSRVGQGTVVLSRIGPMSDQFQWGAVSTVMPGEEICGDSWQIVERPGELSIMLSDGLGHGPLAAEASTRADRAFIENPFVLPTTTVENCHRALSGTRGAAVAAALISASAKSMRYAGVGNIAGSLISPTDGRGLVSHNGIVGVQMRKVQQFDFIWPVNGLLIMHSDGLQHRWNLENYPGLFSRHPATIAAVLHRDFVRGRDDATVAAVRIKA